MIMESIFLNLIQSLSDSRFWLIPILLVCILVVVTGELFRVLKDTQKEMKE